MNKTEAGFETNFCLAASFSAVSVQTASIWECGKRALGSSSVLAASACGHLSTWCWLLRVTWVQPTVLSTSRDLFNELDLSCSQWGRLLRRSREIRPHTFRFQKASNVLLPRLQAGGEGEIGGQLNAKKRVAGCRAMYTERASMGCCYTFKELDDCQIDHDAVS